jgi:hypothetical protein
MSPSFEPEGCVLVRRNLWILGLAMAWMVGWIVLAAHKPAWEDAVDATSIPMVMYGSYVMAMIWRPRVKPVSVRGEARGLRIGERFVPRTAIQTGVLLPGEPAQVRLRLRGVRLPVQLRMGNARDASVLLEVLGLDDAHTVAAFNTSPGVLVDPRLGLHLGFLSLALLVLGFFLMWKFETGAFQWPSMMLGKRSPPRLLTQGDVAV